MGGSFNTAYIYEVIVYNKALSENELQEVNAYLGTKYGKDFVKPVIKLNGDEVVNLSVGEEYVEQGATATDNLDESINNGSKTVEVNNSLVDTSTPGVYDVVYKITDSAGLTATKIRKVYVHPKTPGSVANGIVFWLGFDNPTLESGAEIEKWQDILSLDLPLYNGVDVESNSSAKFIFEGNGLNFNPVVRSEDAEANLTSEKEVNIKTLFVVTNPNHPMSCAGVFNYRTRDYLNVRSCYNDGEA